MASHTLEPKIVLLKAHLWYTVWSSKNILRGFFEHFLKDTGIKELLGALYQLYFEKFTQQERS